MQRIVRPATEESSGQPCQRAGSAAGVARRRAGSGSTVLACGPSSPCVSTNRTDRPTRSREKSPRSTAFAWK